MVLLTSTLIKSTTKTIDITTRLVRDRQVNMGCGLSKKARQDLNVPEQAPLVDADDALLDEKPRPLIFAIIRNGHEVVRGRLRDVEAFLQQHEHGKAESEWIRLRTWIDMHRKMEMGTDDNNGFLGFVWNLNAMQQALCQIDSYHRLFSFALPAVC